MYGICSRWARWLPGLLLISGVPLAAERSEATLEAGLAAFERGRFEEAVESWSGAAQAAASRGNIAEQVYALEFLARGHSALGRYRTALHTLEDALKLAERSGDKVRLASLLGALGNACVAAGAPDTGRDFLQRSVEVARADGDKPRIAAALNDLGNLQVSQRKHADAIHAYRESATHAQAAGLRTLAARAYANTASALLEEGSAQAAAPELKAAVLQLEHAGASHETALTWTRVGLVSLELRDALPEARNELQLQAWGAMTQAAGMAERSGDMRAASYALGHLGKLYEDEHRYAEALDLTRRAVLAAQRVNAPESLYRWQWQAARLLQKAGSPEEAVPAYRRAVDTLQSIRQDFSDARRAQAPFRESAGRVYFEFVDLLLTRSGGLKDPGAVAAHLSEARDVVELLKAAELRDYYRDECVDAALSKVKRLDLVSQSAVVVYPVVLEDRTELLLTVPGALRRVSLPVPARALGDEIMRLRLALEKRTTRQYLVHAQRLYDWVIRPLEAELAALKFDTLVFVPDGPLRTIPMAALHDGERFLIEKYALAITPGLSLTEPRPIGRERLKVLALGLTRPVQGYAALPNVSSELAALRGLFDSKTLVDEAFSLDRLERELKAEPFSVLHVASHGEFHGDAAKSFVLSFDDRLTMSRLEQAVSLRKYGDQPLELLTLSACETAAGSERAALGLAGIAIKAGARSALATLWAVQDELSSELVAEFYRQLKDPSVSRARALQRAQAKAISDPRYEHPGFWSPFLVINNWL